MILVLVIYSVKVIGIEWFFIIINDVFKMRLSFVQRCQGWLGQEEMVVVRQKVLEFRIVKLMQIVLMDGNSVRIFLM